MTKKKALKLIRCVTFLILFAILYAFFTYLLRDTSDNQRRNLLSFYLEKPHTDDVVFIGASSIYRYWDPLYAWNLCGITSFDYACASMEEVSYIPAMDIVSKRQSPKLIVLDARRFLSRKVDAENVPDRIRYFTDSLDLGLSRAVAVHRFCKCYEISLKEEINYQFDLIYYHDNYDAFSNQLNWELSDNRVSKNTEGLYAKGYGSFPEWAHLDRPAVTNNLTSTDLSPRAGLLYRELMEYCQKQDYSVLVVVTPYCYQTEDMAEFMRMEEITKEYNINFVNMNDHLQEIGIDYAVDFYDVNHTNQFGSEKVTTWLSSYISTNYDLPDHRGDEGFADWNEEYETHRIITDKIKEEIRSKLAIISK